MTSWMRDDPSKAGPSHEDYLLGQEIGKNFEQEGTMGQINAVEYDCTPASIFSSRAEHQVDLSRKVQEDPLVAIKKKEIDTRRKVLENPIRMKQIKKYLESTKKDKKSKKDKKKKKKKKRKHRGSDSSSSSDSDSEADLDKLLMQKLDNFQPKRSQQDESEEDDQPKGGDEDRNRVQRREQQRRRSASRSRSPPPPNRRRRSDSRERRRRRSPSPRRRRSRSRSNDRSKRRDRSRDRKKSKKSSSSVDDEERQRRLAEMMSNADWRESQRSKNVAHYKKLDEKEAREFREKEHDPDFISKQLVKAVSAGSVEKRIQSNKHNIQRGGMNMDKNFAKR